MAGKSSKKWAEKGTAREHIEENRAAQAELLHEQQTWDVSGLWLRGYTVRDISDALSLARSTVINMIGEMREQVVNWHKADLEQLAAERIEGFRSIEKEARGLIMDFPKQAATLLSVALRSQENVAKVQGVLSDKVHHLGSVTHHIKLYDFEQGQFPEAIENLKGMETATTPALQEPASVGDGKVHMVIDGEVFEGEVEKIPLKRIEPDPVEEIEVPAPND